MPEYVSKWHISLSSLQSANFYIDIKLCLNQFVHGLPNIAAFNTLWADLQNHVTAAGDRDFGAFVSLTETTLELDSIFRSILHTNQVHSHPPPQQSIPSSVPTTTPSVPAPAPPILSTPHSAAVPYSAKLCSNCGLRGHLAPTCFKAGGGMEGQRAEYKKDRNKVVAMLLADLDDSINSLDESELESNAPVTELFSESIVPNTLDDHIIIPNTANYSVSPESAFISQNDNIHRDLYPLCEPSEFLPCAFAGFFELEHTAYLSLGNRFNLCLDSGCTDHIITDSNLFQNYDTAGAVEIGTANCGSLSAKASGNVSFWVPFDGRLVIFTLKGCLHAPNAPLNLLLVGTLNA